MGNKFKIILIMLLSTIFGCNEKSKMPYYIYNGKEYNEKVKNFKICIDEANNIYAKYYFDEHLNEETKYCVLDIIYDDYYLFPSKPYNLKISKYYLSGYWVNGKTGEIKKVENEEYLDLILEPNKVDKYVKLIKRSDYSN